MKKIIPTEYDEQVLIFKWAAFFEKKYPMLKYLYSSLSGVWLPDKLAWKIKKSGHKKGIPDIFLPYPSKGYHGLYIEVKRIEGGVLSKDQKEWKEYLNSVNYLSVVCKGAKEGIETIKKYLD